MPDNAVNPQLMKATAAFLEELNADAGEEKTMRLVLEIPAEWAKLAAWVYIRRQYQHSRENNEPPPDRPSWGIECPPKRGHKFKAKAELMAALDAWFENTLDSVEMMEHIVLKSLPPRREMTDEERATLDEEIPF
jgi:hypothetical protein